MKKIAFFPYHNDLKVMHPYKDKLEDYEIIGFSSFHEDKQLISGLNQLYGLEEKSLAALLSECDALIVLDDERNGYPDKYYEVLDLAIQNEAELLISPIAASQLDLEKYKGKYNLLKKCPCDESTIARHFENYTHDSLYRIDTPIISVFATGRNCGKFECQLFLDEVLSEQYRTTVVSSNYLGVLFGYYTMPDFLYGSFPFEEKVFRFNLFIHLISKHETPDVLLLGIPEGVAHSEKLEFNHFSEYPLVISAAVPIDMAVLNLYFAPYELWDEGLKKIVHYFENRYFIPVGALCLSSVYYELADDIHPIVFEPISDAFLTKFHPDMSSLSTPVFSMHDRSSAKAVVKNMLKPLQENIKVV